MQALSTSEIKPLMFVLSSP